MDEQFLAIEGVQELSEKELLETNGGVWPYYVVMGGVALVGLVRGCASEHR